MLSPTLIPVRLNFFAKKAALLLHLTSLHYTLIYLITPRPPIDPHHPTTTSSTPTCPSDDTPPPLQIVSYLCCFPPTQASSSLASLCQVTGGPHKMPEAPQRSISLAHTQTHPSRHHLGSTGPSVESRNACVASQVTLLLHNYFYNLSHAHLQLATHSATMCAFVCVFVWRWEAFATCVEVWKCVCASEGDTVEEEHKHREPM